MLIHAVDVEANNNVTSCIITLSPIIDNLGVIYSFLCDFAQKLVHYRTSIHKCHFAIQPSFNWYSGQQLNYKGKWKCICSNIKYKKKPSQTPTILFISICIFNIFLKCLLECYFLKLLLFHVLFFQYCRSIFFFWVNLDRKRKLILAFKRTFRVSDKVQVEMDPQPQPDGEVPDAAKVVGAGEGDESIVGEGVRMQESLAGHTAHLKKISFSLPFST